jgi:hypothetical protein
MIFGAFIFISVIFISKYYQLKKDYMRLKVDRDNIKKKYITLHEQFYESVYKMKNGIGTFEFKRKSMNDKLSEIARDLEFVLRLSPSSTTIGGIDVYEVTKGIFQKWRNILNSIETK